MDRIQLYLSLIGTSLGLFITTITFFTKFIKNSKARKKAYGLIKITECIIKFIEEAEKFIHYSGAEKKEYVMTKIRQLVIHQKLQIDDEKVSETVETLIGMSKHVNVRNTYSDSKELNKLYEEVK